MIWFKLIQLALDLKEENPTTQSLMHLKAKKNPFSKSNHHIICPPCSINFIVYYLQAGKKNVEDENKHGMKRILLCSVPLLTLDFLSLYWICRFCFSDILRLFYAKTISLVGFFSLPLFLSLLKWKLIFYVAFKDARDLWDVNFLFVYFYLQTIYVFKLKMIDFFLSTPQHWFWKLITIKKNVFFIASDKNPLIPCNFVNCVIFQPFLLSPLNVRTHIFFFVKFSQINWQQR